jgi:adenine-specific DNA-methyltransferase
MEKLKLHTPDLVAENVNKLAELFPSCVTETRDEMGNLKRSIDFDQLRQELSAHIVEGPRERYHLDWPGKREAILTANAPIAKTLRPCREESVDFNTTKNIFIEGDNLDALKLLQETYLGKVKLIYIDPPYNTGNDFIYEDDFSENIKGYLVRSNQKDEAGIRLSINQETNGRFHSDWLSMMLPRLKLARNLMRDDGFIVVSVDDAELENMKSLLNEVFGKDNELAVLVWDRNRKNDARYFSVGHEYMCVYAKNIAWHFEHGTILREPKEGLHEAKQLFESLLAKFGNDWTQVQDEWRKFYNAIPASDARRKIGRFSKVGPRGPYRDDGNINWPGSGGPRYEVMHPTTKRPCKLPTSGWRYPTLQRFNEEVSAGRVVFGSDETTVPRTISFLFESDGQVMPSVFYSYAQTVSVEFEELMGAKLFDNPKNWRDLKRIISYLSGPKDIIVDFFAGSASTAQAVMALNAEDDGKRRYLLVQIPQACEAESGAARAGLSTIAEIAKRRIRRAGAKIMQEAPLATLGLDIGFRALKIDLSNMKDVFYTPDESKQGDLLRQIDNIREDRTPEDLLFQVLVDWGLDLALPISSETISGKTVFFVDSNALAACFDLDLTDDLVKEIAKRKPLRAVFRDSSYSSDSVKINVEQIFKLLAPTTEIRSL